MAAFLMLVRALLFGTLVLALAGCGGGGSSSGTEATRTSTATAPIETVAAGETEPALSAEDCTALGTVLSDIKFDTHPDWNFAFDFSRTTTNATVTCWPV
jgi:hypothetical protein